MPDLGPHASFIVGAYGVTVIAVMALVVAIVNDDRRQRRLLAELERKGIRRRSAKSATDGANPEAAIAKTSGKPRRARAPKRGKGRS
jgi:heme exporter protein D